MYTLDKLINVIFLNYCQSTSNCHFPHFLVLVNMWIRDIIIAVGLQILPSSLILCNCLYF